MSSMSVKLTNALLARYRYVEEMPNDLRYWAWRYGLPSRLLGIANQHRTDYYLRQAESQGLPYEHLGVDFPAVRCIQRYLLYRKRRAFNARMFNILQQDEWSWWDKDLHPELERVMKAYNNTKKVCSGQLPEPLSFFYLNWYGPWSRINRGRDLFIKGMGPFDIRQAATKFGSQRRAGRYGPKVVTLQAAGYFPNAIDWGERLLRVKYKRDYVIRHWSVIKETSSRLIDQIDFGIRHFKTHGREYMNVPVAQMLEVWRQTMFPTDLVLEHDEESWSWLSRFQDPEPYKIVRRPQDLITLGKMFNICVGSSHYRQHVADRKSFFVYTKDVVAQVLSSNGYVQQAVGHANSRLTMEQKRDLHAALTLIFPRQSSTPPLILNLNP